MFFSLNIFRLQSTEPLPFFQANKTQPYHVSVGAVLFNKEGLIAVHHFKEILGHKDVYSLMHESVENDEIPLMTLARGLKEEFNATAKPIAFLGSLSGYIPNPCLAFEKTTLYIVCQLIDWNLAGRDLQDREADSTIEWFQPDVLISLMQKQGVRFQDKVDKAITDESEMIKRAFPYIKKELTQVQRLPL